MPRGDFELEERATEARVLLSNPLLIAAFGDLEERYKLGFMNAELGSPQAMSNHSKLKVLNELKRELESVISDQKVSFKKGYKYG